MIKPYRRPIPPGVAGVLGMAGLTPRQAAIVDLYCTERGATHKEAATALGISAQTVKNHVTEILRRTGATHMANVCYQYGLFRQRHHAAGGMRAEDV